ncbi:hypothetical protein ABRP84_05055 [Corynebacterium sp. KPL2861]|uniref:hypothetical protein n=1 Tax=Corynebacterium sp. KPL2861 TaxID=3158319 RepID=UPI0032EA9AF1
MANGKLRPVWPELVTAVLGVALILLAPVRISWIGTVVIVLSVVSAIITLALSKQSAKVQLVGLIIGVIAIAVGLLIGSKGDGQPTIFSPALIWVIGAGLVMSTFCTLLARDLKGNSKQVA